jgi:hypothetical protein
MATDVLLSYEEVWIAESMCDGRLSCAWQYQYIDIWSWRSGRNIHLSFLEINNSYHMHLIEAQL